MTNSRYRYSEDVAAFRHDAILDGVLKLAYRVRKVSGTAGIQAHHGQISLCTINLIWLPRNQTEVDIYITLRHTTLYDTQSCLRT